MLRIIWDNVDWSQTPFYFTSLSCICIVISFLSRVHITKFLRSSFNTTQFAHLPSFTMSQLAHFHNVPTCPLSQGPHLPSMSPFSMHTLMWTCAACSWVLWTTTWRRPLRVNCHFGICPSFLRARSRSTSIADDTNNTQHWPLWWVPLPFSPFLFSPSPSFRLLVHSTCVEYFMRVLDIDPVFL